MNVNKNSNLRFWCFVRDTKLANIAEKYSLVVLTHSPCDNLLVNQIE